MEWRLKISTYLGFGNPVLGELHHREISLADSPFYVVEPHSNRVLGYPLALAHFRVLWIKVYSKTTKLAGVYDTTRLRIAKFDVGIVIIVLGVD